MKLYLVRHAQAQPFSSDPSRGLTTMGFEQARAIGRFLREGGQFMPEEIWHSDLLRSVQTAMVLREEAAQKASLINRNDITPDASVDECYETLCSYNKSVAIVGHQPHLQHLFSRVVNSTDRDMWEMVNGGVACINGCDYYCGVGQKRRRWSLFWMLTPRILGAETSQVE